MKKLLAGCFVMASILSVSGADFKPDRTVYVSNSGSDTNDGLSEKTALKTIGKASEIVNPGDLVLVRGGTYSEHIALKRQGTKEKPIVFRAMPGETVLLTFGWDINNWTKAPNTRFCYKSNFKYAVNMLWEKKTLSRYLELDSMELLDKQPGGFVFDRKTGDIFLHAFDGGNPEFAGIIAVPYSDGKNPVAFNADTSKFHRLHPAFVLNGDYNTIEGFEIAFHPVGARMWNTGVNVKGCSLKNNIIYGASCGMVISWRVADALAENNRIYKTAGTGILVGGKVENITVKDNYLFNNGPCAPFEEQLNGGAGHPFNIARYGGSKGDAVNVDFIGNTVISDDASRRYGVFRCKGGVDGKMIVSGNVFVGGSPHFYAKPDNVSIIENNTLADGIISYEKQTSAGIEYKPELKNNLCLRDNKEKPCFADTSFYDYRLRKDSPFIGEGAYPKAGEILYVNASLKENGDGSTPEKAFNTLSEAFKKASSGNCIYLLPGTYQENISPAKKENISIRNYNHGNVVYENSVIDMKECKNLSIDGIIFRNSKVQARNSDGLEFLHCVFDGPQSGIKAENCGLTKIINDTFTNAGMADTLSGSLILRNNLFMDCKSIPVKSEAEKTISENNAFSGENAGKILTEWKSKYNEKHPSCSSNVKLGNNYVLPEDTKLACSGLGWTFIGARGTENKIQPIVVENLKAANVLSDRATLQWETPFDYPDVNIICKDKTGKAVYSIQLKQGHYKQTVNSECIKGLNPVSQYNFTLIFTRPGGIDKVEKTLPLMTTEKKTSPPKTIYVSKSGDDSKNGLSANDAKKSIGAALKTALAGDTVIVAPGIYTEQNNIDTDGISADKPFILKSEKPGQAVISANYILNTILRINQGKYITIDGFKFTGLRYSATVTALIVSKSEGITVRNCIFDRDWKRRAGGGCSNVQLRCSDSKDLEVSNCIFDNGFHGVWMTNCNNVRIFNNTFWHIGINGVHVGCTKDSNLSIYNNIFEDVVGNHTSPAVSTGEHGKNIICDYNIYWKNDAVCPGQKFYGTGGKEFSAPWHVMKKDVAETIEDARKMYGVETHGQFADPLLKDPKNGDFSVKAGSPAIGKGRNGANIGADMSVFSK